MANRFIYKIPKKDRTDKSPYRLYDPHTEGVRTWSLENKDENSKDQKVPQELRVLSIDPAIKNFALRIESRRNDGLIRGIAFLRSDVSDTSPQAKKDIENTLLCSRVYERISTLLDSHREEYLKCHIVVIERQLPQNYPLVRVSQHVISYFLIKLKNTPLLPLVIEVNSSLKTRQLGAPKGLNERQTKLWAVEHALRLLSWRNDVASIALIQKSKKKDDLADTICQIEALFSYWKLPVTREATAIVSVPLKVVVREKEENPFIPAVLGSGSGSNFGPRLFNIKSPLKYRRSSLTDDGIILYDPDLTLYENKMKEMRGLKEETKLEYKLQFQGFKYPTKHFIKIDKAKKLEFKLLHQKTKEPERKQYCITISPGIKTVKRLEEELQLATVQFNLNVNVKVKLYSDTKTGKEFCKILMPESEIQAGDFSGEIKCLDEKDLPENGRVTFIIYQGGKVFHEGTIASLLGRKSDFITINKIKDRIEIFAPSSNLNSGRNLNWENTAIGLKISPQQIQCSTSEFEPMVYLLNTE